MTTQTILANIVHGTPSGNYDGSSQDWASDAVQAADYYHGRGSLQTLLFRVTDFEGDIVVQATLDSDPATAAWFRTFVYGDGSTVPITDTFSASIPGNFTWIRLVVTDFTGGSIDSVTISY